MSIYYDDETEAFGIAAGHCPLCYDGEQDLCTARNDTGCDAPGCNGYVYDCCGTGCDRGLPGSRCQAAAEAESDEDHEDRINRERAAFGLSPISEEGDTDA
jgi:hypothetical protein